MALNKNTLKQNLINNFTDIRDNVKSKEDSADGFAQAIVDYSSDAVLPAALNSSITTAQIGLPALKSGILASYEAQDATMGLVSTAIVTYVLASFTSFVIGSNSGIGVSTMTIPPVFAPSMAIGMGGGSIEDVSDSLATTIHVAYLSIVFTGIVILSGAAGTVVTAMPIL